MTAQDWRHRAACRNLDPEIFFPVAEAGPVRARQEARAKAVCARCPVVAQCLTWALESGQGYGVWGGTSEHERREIQRRRAPSPGDPAPRRRSDPSPLVGRSHKGARVRAQGIEMLASGRFTRRQVAQVTGADIRTVERWAARPEVRPHVRPTPRPRSAPITRDEARRSGARAVRTS